jgi:hypothetical protein
MCKERSNPYVGGCEFVLGTCRAVNISAPHQYHNSRRLYSQINDSQVKHNQPKGKESELYLVIIKAVMNYLALQPKQTIWSLARL